MKFTPNYTVSYRGEFYRAGETIEIDPADVKEMAKHGTVEKAREPPEKKPVRKGRKKEA